MKIVFRSSFLLALTCSKRICFPPDTDSFCACERMGLEHLGAGTRGSGLTSYTGGGGAGRRNAERRRPSAQRPGPLAPAAPKPAPPDAYTNQPSFPGVPAPVYRSRFFSCRRISVASRFRLFHINEEGLFTAPLFCDLNGEIKKASFAYHRSGCIFFMQAVQIPRELPHSRPGRKADAR